MIYFMISIIGFLINQSFGETSPKSEALLLNQFLETKEVHLLEKISHRISQYRGKTIYRIQSPSEFIPHPNLGYIHRPSSQIRHIHRTLDKIVYNVTYSFDQFSRRTYPNDIKEKRDFFLILHGCSFTYGNGLDDHQTLSYFTDHGTSQFKSYNYAIGASAPNIMLAHIQENNLKKQIAQKKGVFTYIYIDGHITRSNGFLQELSWMEETPYYNLKDGKLIRKQSFKEGSPLRTKFFRFLRDKLSVDTIFERNFPSISESHINYTCRLIAESRNEFLSQFPDSKFIMLIHPLSFLKPKLKSCLLKENVQIVDDLNIDDLKFNRLSYIIENDGHPNEKFNRFLANALIEKVSTLMGAQNSK